MKASGRAQNWGTYLRDHRERKGLAQKELAGKLGVSPQHLCDLEFGRRRPTDAIVNHAILLLDLDAYEACWIAGRLPGEVEELLLEAGPQEWRRLMEGYGRLVAPGGAEGRVRVRTKGRTERLLERSGRITPREVLGAYRETGIKPCASTFILGDFLHGYEACAIGALAMRDGVYPTGDDLDGWIERKTAGQGPSYATGFWKGFDGESLPPFFAARSAQARKGWRDGARCRRFVFGGK